MSGSPPGGRQGAGAAGLPVAPGSVMLKGKSVAAAADVEQTSNKPRKKLSFREPEIMGCYRRQAQLQRRPKERTASVEDLTLEVRVRIRNNPAYQQKCRTCMSLAQGEISLLYFT